MDKKEVVRRYYEILNKYRIDQHDLVDLVGHEYANKTYRELSNISEVLYKEMNSRMAQALEEILEIKVGRL